MGMGSHYLFVGQWPRMVTLGLYYVPLSFSNASVPQGMRGLLVLNAPSPAHAPPFDLIHPNTKLKELVSRLRMCMYCIVQSIYMYLNPTSLGPSPPYTSWLAVILFCASQFGDGT